VLAPRSRGMTEDTEDWLTVERLAPVALLLVVVWLALEVVGEVFEIAALALGPLYPVVTLAVLGVVVAWLLDYV